MKIIFFLLILFPIFIFSETYFVSNSGNNNNSGLHPDSAFQTLQYASDLVIAGDTVLIINGDYIGFDIRTSGTQTQPIVFKALGDSARITTNNTVTNDGINIENADWIEIDGFNIINMPRAGIRAAVAQHITIRNNICDSNNRWGIFTGFADYAVIENNVCFNTQEQHGIYFSNSADYPTIRGNISYNNNGCGIHMNGDESMGGDGLITGAIVEGNIIYGNGNAGGSGINCDGVAESFIFNNLLYNNHSSGISLYRIDASAGSYNTKVYNNTIIQANDGRWCININSGSTADTLYNNIFLTLHSYRGSISIDASSTIDFCSDYNIVMDRMSNDWGNSVMTLTQWQALGYDQHSQISDPFDSIFLNFAGNDYHLKDLSQPIDIGTPLVSQIVNIDLDSNPRPMGAEYDIGCYEYISSYIEENINYRNGSYKVYYENLNLVFENLEANDYIRIYDLSGRLLHNSSTVFGNKYLWRTNSANNIYFYIISNSNSKNFFSGKILMF